jgi:hypothetical protein
MIIGKVGFSPEGRRKQRRESPLGKDQGGWFEAAQLQKLTPKAFFSERVE